MYHCGLNIERVTDPAYLVDFTEILPDVAVARHLEFTCSDTSQETIDEDIKKMDLDRGVVMANIREQCSWVRVDKLARALEKAK